MSSYKLIYFNSRGRAEGIRFIFAQAGIEYEDKRIDKKDWPQLKPTTPTGMLPVLEVDGKQLASTVAIVRFLAERFDLAGSNDFENAELASIGDVLEDFLQKIAVFYYEKDDERKAALKKQIEDEHIPKYWSIIEKRIQNNSTSNWIYGDKPTYVDLITYCWLELISDHFPNFLDSYPGVAKVKASVESLPNIAKWIKERPKTEH